MVGANEKHSAVVETASSGAEGPSGPLDEASAASGYIELSGQLVGANEKHSAAKTRAGKRRL